MLYSLVCCQLGMALLHNQYEDTLETLDCRDVMDKRMKFQYVEIFMYAKFQEDLLVFVYC